MSWKAIMRNNTDYKRPVEFTNCAELERFIRRYYRGEEGGLYWEKWEVKGEELPSCLYKLLDPPAYDGDVWRRK